MRPITGTGARLMIMPYLQLTEDVDGMEIPQTLPFPPNGDPTKVYEMDRFDAPGDALRALQHLTMTLDELLSELEGDFQGDEPPSAA